MTLTYWHWRKILRLVAAIQIILVPTLPRGNAYPPAFFRYMSININQPVWVDLYPMRYHAGAWERDIVGLCYR